MTDTREYYPNRPLAMTAANRGQLKYQEQGCRSATAQFQPDKGFVAVLFCERNIPEAWEEGFEIQLMQFTPQKTPDNWAAGHAKRKTQGAQKTAPTAGAMAPTKGSTARVWAIADALHAEAALTRADRGKVLAVCRQDGIAEATASTQWSKWAKARGL